MRVEQLYGIPVLLSGTASLVLKQSELNILNIHLKKKLENLQKLHQKTPDPVVYFLAGSLPASAILHLCQFSIFSMITRLPNNILNRIAKYILTTSRDSSNSWFIQVRNLCQQYNLTHPLSLLNSPMSKHSAKRLFKTKVVDYWQTKLRNEASCLDSLIYFKPQFMSLLTPHPLWSTCGSNSYEVCKAIIQAKMLSGRYRTDQLLRHFTDNDGSCVICSDQVPGNIQHLLLICPALTDTRNRLWNNFDSNSDMSDLAKSFVKNSFKSIENATQLLLDPSVLSGVISIKQKQDPFILHQ